MAHLTNFESQFKAHSREIRTLRDKNENLEKHIKDLDDVKEDYNKLKDDHGQLSSLVLPWRCAFLLVGSATPGFFINCAIKGNSWYNMMGSASVTTCGGAMILYYFASLDRHDHDNITNEGGQQRPLSSFKSFLALNNRRDDRSLAIFGLWLTTCEVSLAIGNLHTDPNGGPFHGWLCLSTILGSIRPSSTL